MTFENAVLLEAYMLRCVCERAVECVASGERTLLGERRCIGHFV